MMMVRPETPEEASSIHRVHLGSFPSDNEARLVTLLRDADQLTVSLVAEIDEAIVGHIAFSPVKVASGEIGMGLAPVAVVESHRMQGIATALILSGLDECHEAGFGWAVVLGDPGFYSQFGFEPASDFGLFDEYGGGAAFQAIELSPGKIPRGGGLVKYATQFGAFQFLFLIFVMLAVDCLADEPRPNVVMLFADDMGWTDYGFMGHEVVKTPNLDRLDGEGVLFPNGYVPTSLCRASLATLLTGLYASQHKI